MMEHKSNVIIMGIDYGKGEDEHMEVVVVKAKTSEKCFAPDYSRMVLGDMPTEMVEAVGSIRQMSLLRQLLLNKDYKPLSDEEFANLTNEDLQRISDIISQQVWQNILHSDHLHNRGVHRRKD